jgi:hypothetical protein
MIEKRQPLQQMLLGKWIYACKNLKLVLCLSPCISINAKEIKGLNIRPETEPYAGKNRDYTGINRHKQ